MLKNKSFNKEATTGSPTHPKPNEASVIPSWQTERYFSKLLLIDDNARPRHLNSKPTSLTCEALIFTKANSEATKKAITYWHSYNYRYNYKYSHI